MPRIKIKNLTASYFDKKKRETVALQDFSVEFENEKINVIVGESGCGKTTLLKCICQQMYYDGDIFFNNEDISKIDPRKINIGYVSQNFALYPKMTVFENIAFPLLVKKTHPDDINYLVRYIADKFDLMPCLTRLPKEISIGQQQRVAIARALVKKPDICLFDEVLTNLDKPLTKYISDLLKKVLKEIKCTTIYVTHDCSEAFSIADKLFVMSNSKIEVSGTVDEVIDSKNETIKYLKESSLNWKDD